MNTCTGSLRSSSCEDPDEVDGSPHVTAITADIVRISSSTVGCSGWGWWQGVNADDAEMPNIVYADERGSRARTTGSNPSTLDSGKALRFLGRSSRLAPYARVAVGASALAPPARARSSRDSHSGYFSPAAASVAFDTKSQKTATRCRLLKGAKWANTRPWPDSQSIEICRERGSDACNSS